jgi:hypothetical protein|tara:strand:- start:7953 stop:8654 length:702 start_codon:yes stop_codon:yes gene_type:complete
MYYLRRFIIILVIQLLILSFISTIFIFNFNLERESLKIQSKQFTELVAKQAGIFFSNDKSRSSKDFLAFLDSKIGIDELSSAFTITKPDIISVYFVDDIISGKVNAGVDENFQKNDKSEINQDKRFFFNNKYVAIKPFYKNNDETIGVVRVEVDNIPLVLRTLSTNAVFYLLLFLILNNQAFLFYLWTKKKRPPVDDSSYIKEGSIGSIKIMQKIINQIIEDHKNDSNTNDKK